MGEPRLAQCTDLKKFILKSTTFLIFYSISEVFHGWFAFTFNVLKQRFAPLLRSPPLWHLVRLIACRPLAATQRLAPRCAMSRSFVFQLHPHIRGRQGWAAVRTVGLMCAAQECRSRISNFQDLYVCILLLTAERSRRLLAEGPRIALRNLALQPVDLCLWTYEGASVYLSVSTRRLSLSPISSCLHFAHQPWVVKEGRRCGSGAWGEIRSNSGPQCWCDLVRTAA